MPDSDKLTFLGQFIDKYFLKQAPWVQAFTFLFFVILFGYGVTTVIGGKHVIGGRIWVSQPDRDHKDLKVPAKNYDVVHGLDNFGTSSKGTYQVVLSPFEYAELMTAGNMKLTILKGDLLLMEPTVRLARLQDMFDDIVLPPATGNQAHAPMVSPAPASRANPFTAWAAPVSSNNSQLVVYLLEVVRGNPDVKQVNVELQLDGQSASLLATRTASPSGPVPVISGEPVVFGKDYFFQFPSSGQSSKAIVRISAKTGIFSSYTEDFSLPSPVVPGQILPLSGQRGSRIQLILTFPYNVTLWDRDDVQGRKERLTDSLLKIGLVLRETVAPLGSRSATNAIFGGAGVPFNAIQAVLRCVNGQGIDIKTIQYHQNLKSRDQYEIQIGGVPRCDERHPMNGMDNPVFAIPPEAMNAILAASSEPDFVRLATPYASCTTPAHTTPARPTSSTKKR